MKLNSFDLILGIDFIREHQCVPMPYLNWCLFAQRDKSFFVLGVPMVRSEVKSEM